MEKKYVIVNGNLPIVFSAAQKHSDFNEFNITSAGFFSISKNGEISTYGKSISLKLKPNKFDVILLKMLLSNESY